MQTSKSKKGLKDGCTPALGGPGCWRRKEGALVEEPQGTDLDARDGHGRFMPLTGPVSSWEADMEAECHCSSSEVF